MRDPIETELEPTMGLTCGIVFGDEDDGEDNEDEGLIYDEY